MAKSRIAVVDDGAMDGGTNPIRKCDSIETFVALGHVCPVCNGDMELSVGFDLDKGIRITGMWICSNCGPSLGHKLIYEMTLEFNRGLSLDEQNLIRDAMAGVRQKQRAGQDVSGELIDLTELGIYCTYTLRCVDSSTGEESVHEVDARVKIDWAKVIKAVRMEHLRNSILDPNTEEKDANRMIKELVHLEKLDGKEAVDFVMDKFRREQTAMQPVKLAGGDEA